MANGGGVLLDQLFWEISIRVARAEAERDALAAGQAAGQSFDKGFQLDTPGQKGAKMFVDSLSQDLFKRREEIKQAAVAGLLTANEAAAAGRQAAAQFSKELRAGVSQLQTQGVIGKGDVGGLLARGADAMRLSRMEAEKLAYQLNSVEKATTVAGGGLRNIRGPLTQLATSALGVNTNVGRLASSLALLGVGATLTIGITLGIAAIAFAYNKITESAREARKKIDDVIDGLKKQLEQEERTSSAGLRRIAAVTRSEADAARKRFIEAAKPRVVFDQSSGRITGSVVDEGRLAQAAKDLKDAKARVDAAERNASESRTSREERYVASLGRSIAAGKANAAIIGEAAARVREYTKRLDELVASGSKSEATLTQINRLQSLISDLTPSASKPGRTPATPRARAEKPDRTAEIEIQNARELAAELETLTAQSTITAVDDMQLALKRLLAAMEAKGASPELLNQVKALQQPMIDATARSEELSAALDGIERDVAEGFNLTGRLADVGGLIEKATAARDAAPKGSTVQKTAQTELNHLIALELEIRKKIKDIQDGVTAKTKAASNDTVKLAGDIANAANAAYLLAAAFLGVDDNITKAIASIGELAGGISNAAAGIASGNALQTIAGIGQVVKGGLGLAQALGLGTSPEEKERLQRLKENNEALRNLSDRIGDLGANITGSEFGAVRSAVSNTNLLGLRSTDQLSRVLGANLTALGLSFKDLAAFAKELGIEIDTNRIQFGDVLAIQEAIRKAELGQFADTFAGQMAKLNSEISIFDITDPIEQFRRLRRSLDGIDKGGGALSQLIDTFDLSNPEGLAGAIAALQKLFTDVTAGAIDPSQFGGLTGQELIDAITRSIDLLRASPGSGTGGFNVVSTITEATGSRIGGLMTTGNIFAQQTAENTALIARILAMSANIGPIGPPPLVLPSGGIGGTHVTFSGPINIAINGEAATPDVAKRLGKAFTDAAVAEMDKRLGERVRWMKRVNGDLT